MAVETAKEVSPPLYVDLELLCQKLLYWKHWFCQVRCFQKLLKSTRPPQVNNDPKLKTKAEKDRRLKEKQAANTKKIIDERKSKGMKENKASWKEEHVNQFFLG